MDYEVYVITAPGYWYVGSTRQGVQTRFRQHMSGAGKAGLLREKVRQLGQDAFQVEVLEDGILDRLEAERRWYDIYVNRNTGCSLNSRRPWAFPEPTSERNAKISASKKGVPKSPEHRAKIGDAQRGRKQTPESNAKRSASLRGHPNWMPAHPTDQTRAKLSAAKMGNTNCVGRIPWNKGQVHPPAVRARMSFHYQRACKDCGLITNPGALGRHTKATGHHPVKLPESPA